MRWLFLPFVGGLPLLFSCAEAPAPRAAVDPPPEPPPAPGAEPTADAPVHACDQDASAESPIREGKLGEGERLVRLFNNSEDDIQARLLDGEGRPAVAGTLVVEAGETGEFYVEAGKYMVRYRFKGSCEVRQGALLQLTGPRAGVEISIKPRGEMTDRANMQKVSDPL